MNPAESSPDFKPSPDFGQRPDFRQGPDFRRSMIRALFGPVMLMVIGILFVVEYAGGPHVSQTWPILIIAAGLMKLGEYAGGKV